MKNVSICLATIFLFVQIANANGGLPVNNLTAPVNYVKAPMRFKSYSSYLHYVSIKAFKGVDSAIAFYRKKFKEAAYTYTDYLPLTGGTLTGALAGTDANFSGTVSFGGNASVGNTANFAGYHFGIGTTNGNGFMMYQANANSYVFGVLRDNTEGPIVNMYKPDGSTIGNRISTYGASYFNGGNIGIGTTTPSEKLSVNGNVSAKKMIVTQTGWSDYVFNKNYKLRSLQSLESYINLNKRLPETPSTEEVKEKGISVGETQALLLKKIEELTLYVIELNKKTLVQQKHLDMQTNEIKQLKHKMQGK